MSEENKPEVETPAVPAEETTTEAVAETPAVEEVVAEETAVVAAEEVVVEEAKPEPVAEREPAMFKGEIRGRVYTMEEVKAIDAESAAEDEFSASDSEMLKLYEATLNNVTENEIVTGRIVTISAKDVVIDIGFKSDGIVSRNEFGEELEVGQEVDVYLERVEDYHGQLVLSKRYADEMRQWQAIEEAFNNETIVEGVIIRRIKGGMIVDLFGKEAFLPGSQIDVRPVRDFDAYLERRMEFKVVKLNATNGNVVVSHKALIEKDLEEQRGKILEKMEAGQILEGAVKNITDFGVFIDLGGVDGLLHITDLSWGRVSHPSEMVELDQKLNVVVLDYDKERQRISLGLKQLQSHPWENIDDKFAEEMEMEGKVVSITDYGAFVELEKGIEGLVHISEMSWTEHVKHPTQMVQLGEDVKVKILRIDRDNKKISLGMKQLKPDPWEGIIERCPAGTILHGKVRNLTTFGVFVELEPGIDGLVHISDLSWTKKIRHPAEVVKKGQDLDVVVLNIDKDNRRISLGHKQVSTNPWTQFELAYGVDSDVTAKVARFIDEGIIVELPLEVEAFLPVRELMRGIDAYAVGDELQLVVTKFDLNRKEITLSEKAIEQAKERAERRAERKAKDAKRKEEQANISAYQKSEKSGPATIGELSGLAALKMKMEAAEAEATVAKAAEATVAKAAEKATEAKKDADVTTDAADATADSVENESTEDAADAPSEDA